MWGMNRIIAPLAFSTRIFPGFRRIRISLRLGLRRLRWLTWRSLIAVRGRFLLGIRNVFGCFPHLAQLKDDGYKPSDPALFDKNISALSAGISDFVASKSRESYLAHASCPIVESVKRDLLVSPGSAFFLFDQPLLEKVVTAMKEDSIISSTASLASLSKAASRGRSGASGSDRYSSPLDFSRPGSSG